MKKPKNVLTLPSVLFSVLAVAFFNFDKPAQDYFETGKFKPLDLQKAGYYTLAALVASASARYSEDKDDSLYTPGVIPGRSKVDVISEYEEIPVFIEPPDSDIK